MDRALPRPLTLDIRLPLAFLGVWALFLVDWRELVPHIVGPLLNGQPALDFELYRESGRLIASGQSPYTATVEACGHWCAFRHSPLVAWFWALPIPLEIWRVAHLAVLPLLGPWLGLATLLSWPLWSDVAMGQPMTFAFVLAVLALRGNRWAGLGFLVMATLMPRPIMLPVAGWLLWTDRRLLVPLLAISAVHLGLAWPWLGEWIGSLSSATGDMANSVQVAPSRWIGGWWVVIGLPLAAWLTWRGRLGLAALCASPYWFGYYLLFALLRPPTADDANEDRRAAAAGTHSGGR